MKLKIMVGLIASVVVFGQAWGSIISVNFDAHWNTDGQNSTPAISPNASAGVVAATNWNNVASSGSNLGSFNLSGVTFKDDANNDTSLAVSSTKTAADSWNTVGSADQIIYGDWINAGSGVTISLSNIPYTTYDLYVYESHYSSGEVFDFTVGDQTKRLTSTQFPWDFASNGHIENDTYVKFSGLTGADINVVVSQVSGDVGIAGFQIAQVPEPATIGLFGLAAVGILARRRRAKA